MKILIDSGGKLLQRRIEMWPEKVAGQLITPLSGARRYHDVFAFDNGAYTQFKEKRFIALLKREYEHRDKCLFVAVPDKVGSHNETLKMWSAYNHLADGYKKAFVAQDGYEGYPDGTECLFIGGTNDFKDTQESFDAVVDAKKAGLFVHVGRVTGVKRFMFYEDAGADTCDGSGLTRFDATFLSLRDRYKKQKNQHVLL